MNTALKRNVIHFISTLLLIVVTTRVFDKYATDKVKNFIDKAIIISAILAFSFYSAVGYPIISLLIFLIPFIFKMYKVNEGYSNLGYSEFIQIQGPNPMNNNMILGQDILGCQNTTIKDLLSSFNNSSDKLLDTMRRYDLPYNLQLDDYDAGRILYYLKIKGYPGQLPVCSTF